MLREQQGEILRSKGVTWADGGTNEIPLDFLHVTRTWAAPVIRNLLFHLRFTDVTGVTATILSEDGYKAFARVKIRDQGGTRYDLPGTLGRLVEQLEYGSRQTEPNGGATVTSGGTSAEYNIFLYVPFEVPKARRPADYRMPVPHLTDGGELSVTFGTPPGGTFSGGTLRVYADCVDEREREAKSRIVYKERSITAQEDDYQVGGLLRAAFVSSELTTAGYTALPFSTFASMDSRTLGYSDLDTMIVCERYRKASIDRASDDEFAPGSDEETVNAIPLITPYPNQKIVSMMDLTSMHLDLNGAAPTGGRLVTSVVTNRHAGQTARWLGFPSPGDMLAALRDRGFVNTAKGSKTVRGGKDSRSVAFWQPSLVRKMPFKIRALG